MPCAGKVIDEDGPFDVLMLAKSPGMCDFLLHAAMRRVVFPWMRFARIHKHKDETLTGKSLRHRLKRWRRQRAVRSGVRAKLHQHIPLAPVVTQPHLLARLQENGGEVGSMGADTRTRGKAVKVALAFEDGVVVGCGVGHGCLLFTQKSFICSV